MIESFARTLSLLRREKKISQRDAARALGVSQALLSHYENGLREPGLEFVVRASDYYEISSDYLLGRTMERTGAQITLGELHDAVYDKDNRLQGSVMAMLQKKLIVNSISVIFDMLGKAGSKKLIDEGSIFMTLAVYKLFRYIYLCGENNSDSFFSVPAAAFPEIADSEMKLCETKLNCIAAGQHIPSLADEKLKKLSAEMTHDTIKRDYPVFAQSLFTLLHSVGERLTKKL